MGFLRSLLVVAGVATALYQLLRGDEKPQTPPNPPQPPPRPRPASPPPRQYNQQYNEPQSPCQCETCRRQRQLQQRRPVEGLLNHQQSSPQQTVFRPQPSSPTRAYQPPIPQQQYQSSQIESTYSEAVSYNEDSNDADQRDPYYLSLRSQAKKEGDLMSRCFDEGRWAYTKGNHTQAKQWSNKGNQHKERMEKLNEKASEWIFTENNRGNDPCEVDLHGLYVKEAVNYAERCLKGAQTRGDPAIRFIVGKGLHSENGNAKIKPAIEQYLQTSGLSVRTLPGNTGVLVVQLHLTRRRSSVDEYPYRDDDDDFM